MKFLDEKSPVLKNSFKDEKFEKFWFFSLIFENNIHAKYSVQAVGHFGHEIFHFFWAHYFYFGISQTFFPR